jgi:hypothetical protein
MTGYAIVKKDNTGWAVVVARSLEDALAALGWTADSVRLREEVPYLGNRVETWVVAQSSVLGGAR